jgi:Rrf2 family cysteine metabolism transcriptional repressor
MLEMALRFGNEPVQIREIAKNQKIPIRFLEQLLLVLKRAGITISTRGQLGGYNLAKHPSDITALSVIEALEGPIELTNAKMKKSPVLLEAFKKIGDNIKKELAELTLEDLAFHKRQQDRAANYSI